MVLRRTLVIGVSMLALCWCFVAAAESTDQRLKFMVVAVSDEADIRSDFEGALVERLKADNYDAVSSHTLLPSLSDFSHPNTSQELQKKGIQGILLLTPIDVGEQASIKSVKPHLWPKSYGSIESFVHGYRDGNFDTQVVLQVSGFLISENNLSNFWQGIIWLDDTVTTRQEGIAKLSELVLSNLNASRPYLRKLLGFEPLHSDSN